MEIMILYLKERVIIVKKYIKDTKKLFKLINNKKYRIVEIKPVRKIKRKGTFTDTYISSYCIIYEKMI